MLQSLVKTYAHVLEVFLGTSGIRDDVEVTFLRVRHNQVVLNAAIVVGEE